MSQRARELYYNDVIPFFYVDVACVSRWVIFGRLSKIKNYLD